MIRTIALLTASVVGGGIIVAILAECVTRLRYGRHLEYRPVPDTHWELKPNQRGFTLAGRRPATINRLGFRGPEVARGFRGCRVLVGGDSFAFGYGVGDGETLPYHLERELTRRTGRPCQVVNLGVPGYGVQQMIRVLERSTERYRPRIVMLVMIRGDVARQITGPRPPDASPGRLARAILRKSALAALVKPRLERVKDALGIGRRMTLEWFEEAFDELWARDRAKIREFAAWLKDRGAEFVFVPYASHSSDRDFAAIARRDLGRDIIVVDGIYAALERYSSARGRGVPMEDDPELRIAEDGHPTGLSYHIAAGVIVDALEESVLRSGGVMERT